MGRVDEAMRRAAGESAVEPLTGQDAEDLANEPFPVELSEVRLRRTPELPALTAAPAAAPAERPREARRRDEDAPAETLVPEAEAKPPSLFERLDAKLAEKVVVDKNMMSASREQYRRLAAALYRAQEGSELKVIMLASALAGEGKTLTAANLALTLSESYQRNVLLIDADLRRPSLHGVFQIKDSTGLAEGLSAIEERKMPLHQISPWLTILPAGKPTSDPMAGLTSSRMRRLVQEARATFDWVLIDTPPVGILPDAHLLAAMADGTVLVVKAGSTPYSVVQRAVNSLGQDHILGIVLNRAASTSRSYYGYYHNYYYGARP